MSSQESAAMQIGDDDKSKVDGEGGDGGGSAGSGGSGDVEWDSLQFSAVTENLFDEVNVLIKKEMARIKATTSQESVAMQIGDDDDGKVDGEGSGKDAVYALVESDQNDFGHGRLGTLVLYATHAAAARTMRVCFDGSQYSFNFTYDFAMQEQGEPANVKGAVGISAIRSHQKRFTTASSPVLEKTFKLTLQFALLDIVNALYPYPYVRHFTSFRVSFVFFMCQ
jgi:hypothetical protein